MLRWVFGWPVAGLWHVVGLADLDHGEKVLAYARGGLMSVDRERFERLCRDHSDAVVRYCLRRCGQEDGPDAAAETLMVVARLKKASSDTTLDALPGGRNVTDYLPEVVASLLDVTGTLSFQPSQSASRRNRRIWVA